MPDFNSWIDQAMQLLLWLLPGLLILIVVLLALSFVDRRPKRKGGDRQK